MAIGRISGSVLKSNLTRNGTDLAFETNLLYLDVTNSRIGIGTSEPSTTLHVNGNTTLTGDLSLSGSLSLSGNLSPGQLSFTGNSITTSQSNADLELSAAGTGTVVVNGLSFPTADGTSGQVLQTNGSGTLSFTTISTNSVSQGDSNVTVADSGTGAITITADGNVELVINDTNATFSGPVVIKSRNAITLNDTDNSNYIALRAPATVTSNTTHTLPDGYGTSGQVLSTDGAGILSWADGGGGGGGGSSYPNSTIQTAPGSSGNYDLAEGPAQDGDETPFEAGGTDPFGVNLGTVFDAMDPIGTTTTLDYGDGEAYVGA